VTRALLTDEQRASRALMSSIIAEEMLILNIIDLGGSHAGAGIRGSDRAAHTTAIAAAKADPASRDPTKTFSLERKREAAKLKEQYLDSQRRDAAAIVASNQRYLSVIAGRQALLQQRLDALRQQYGEVAGRARAKEDEASALDALLQGLVAERQRWREAAAAAEEALENNEVKVRILTTRLFVTSWIVLSISLTSGLPPGPSFLSDACGRAGASRGARAGARRRNDAVGRGARRARRATGGCCGDPPDHPTRDRGPATRRGHA
jgi:hypothetical protein